MEYTKRVDGFQIRDITYFCDPPAEPSRRYDVVKWVSCSPHEVYSLRQNKYITITEYCFSIGTLEWDEKESDFEFKSVGLRALEYPPTKRARKMILDFCKKAVDGYART